VLGRPYAGARVDRVTGKTPAPFLKAMRAAPPTATVATAGQSAATREAWLQAGRPGALFYLSDDPDPVAVRLDLRPWGHDPVALMEEGDAGLPPRSDLW